MRRLALLPLPLLAAVPASGPVAALAGRYSQSFPNALVSGETYTSENIVEIVPVSANAAYLRIHTEWYNGHECGLFGVAEAERGALVYREPAGSGSCTLTVRRAGGKLLMDDGGGSCSAYCGARGSFHNVDLPFASRRPITYLKRLRASSEYREALSAWRGR